MENTLITSFGRPYNTVTELISAFNIYDPMDDFFSTWHESFPGNEAHSMRSVIPPGACDP